jgi:hypothetical protein
MTRSFYQIITPITRCVNIGLLGGSMGSKKEYVPPVGPGSKSVAPIAENMTVAQEYASTVATRKSLGRSSIEGVKKDYVPPVGPGSKSVAP